VKFSTLFCVNETYKSCFLRQALKETPPSFRQEEAFLSINK
jgi:hypothetical protein